nr:nanos homolog 3-like [Caretta caretta]
MDALERRCRDAATFDFWTDYLGLCALVGPAAALRHPEQRFALLRPFQPAGAGGASQGGCAGGAGPLRAAGTAPQEVFGSHLLKGLDGRVLCPALRACTCPLGRARGDNAHTRQDCPLSRQLSPLPAPPAPLSPRAAGSPLPAGRRLPSPSAAGSPLPAPRGPPAPPAGSPSPSAPRAAGSPLPAPPAPLSQRPAGRRLPSPSAAGSPRRLPLSQRPAGRRLPSPSAAGSPLPAPRGPPGDGAGAGLDQEQPAPAGTSGGLHAPPDTGPRLAHSACHAPASHISLTGGPALPMPPHHTGTQIARSA